PATKTHLGAFRMTRPFYGSCVCRASENHPKTCPEWFLCELRNGNVSVSNRLAETPIEGLPDVSFWRPWDHPWQLARLGTLPPGCHGSRAPRAFRGGRSGGDRR